MAIQIKNVSESNWFSCTQIEVSEEQKNVFPVSNVYWLAESAYCSFIPLAIYWDNELIGFSVYALHPEDNNYWIMAFMIDKNHQNKGFGKLAMIKLINFIKEGMVVIKLFWDIG